MSALNKNLRTWVEIDKKALRHNTEQFLKLIPKHTRLMAVIKSNAYGHGLALIAKQLANYQLSMINNRRLWFGVDSIVEALRLRREGVKNPILVLGSTLPLCMKEAADHNIIITVSNFESLSALAKLKSRPQFHLKIDTGMHRQGFLLNELGKLIQEIRNPKFEIRNSLKGVYTHFAAKDWGYPAYTELQFAEFKNTLKVFERAGFKNLVRHAAASDAALLFPEAHSDMVRVGMGLYGYWPSWVAKIKHPKGISLKPVLTWKTVVSEVKIVPKGSYVGYDLTEQLQKNTKTAVLPIGYWHGYDRGLSSIGEVLIRGRRAKVLGRVSMDMVIVDVSNIPKVRVGDEAGLIGEQAPRSQKRPGSRRQSRLGRKDEIWADELALKIGTSQYEFLTRINPLIKRILV